MIHYRAAQIADGPLVGRWHYVAGNVAVGYCSPIDGCEECMGTGRQLGSPPPGFEAGPCGSCGGKGFTRRPAPCQGHDTPAAAAEHYRDYLLDQRVRISESRSQQRRCEVCEEWTQGVVTIGTYRMHTLCPEHQDRASIAAVMGPIGESWES